MNPFRLSDERWNMLAPLLPPAARTGRARVDDRRVLEAILYALGTGCRWQDIPLEYGPSSTIRKRLRQWIADGTWTRLRQALLASLDTQEKLLWAESFLEVGLPHAHTPKTFRKDDAYLRLLNDTLEKRIAKHTQQVRLLATRLTLAEQEERQRIAHILHNDLQQQLYALELNLNMLRNPVSAEEDENLLAESRDILKQATALTRSLSREISPPVLNSNNLEDLFQWLAMHYEKTYDLQISIEMHEAIEIPQRELRVLLHQILRELLFNIVKHARSHQVTITAWLEGVAVMIEVADNGRGFDVTTLMQEKSLEGGFGLHDVRERLKLIGGQFQIESTLRAGTRIRLMLPL